MPPRSGEGSSLAILGEETPRAKTVGNVFYPEPVTRYSLGQVWTGTNDVLTQQANFAADSFVRAVFRGLDWNCDCGKNGRAIHNAQRKIASISLHVNVAEV